MQVMAAELGEDDFNIIKSIFEKYRFMKELGLKAPASKAIKIYFMQQKTEPIIPKANKMNIDEICSGRNRNPSVYDELPVDDDIKNVTKHPDKQSQEQLDFQNEFVNHVETSDISSELPTNPASKKLHPTGKNTGLNGGYWSTSPKSLKRSTSVKNLVKSFKSCTICKFNGTKKAMIKCDQCIKWFHRKCARLSNDPKDKDLYFCKACQINANKEEQRYRQRNIGQTHNIDLEPKLYKGCPCGYSGMYGYMIACDSCQRWFHGRCVKLSKKKSLKIDKYYCGECIVKNLKIRIKQGI